MNQDIGSLFSGWGKRREIYGYDAASQEERGSRQIISVEGITFRCWNETFSIGNFVPDCTHKLSGEQFIGALLSSAKNFSPRYSCAFKNRASLECDFDLFIG
jgi:hypothetical protein